MESSGADRLEIKRQQVAEQIRSHERRAQETKQLMTVQEREIRARQGCFLLLKQRLSRCGASDDPPRQRFERASRLYRQCEQAQGRLGHSQTVLQSLSNQLKGHLDQLGEQNARQKAVQKIITEQTLKRVSAADTLVIEEALEIKMASQQSKGDRKQEAFLSSSPFFTLFDSSLPATGVGKAAPNKDRELDDDSVSIDLTGAFEGDHTEQIDSDGFCMPNGYDFQPSINRDEAWHAAGNDHSQTQSGEGAAPDEGDHAHKLTDLVSFEQGIEELHTFQQAGVASLEVRYKSRLGIQFLVRVSGSNGGSLRVEIIPQNQRALFPLYQARAEIVKMLQARGIPFSEVKLG